MNKFIELTMKPDDYGKVDYSYRNKIYGDVNISITNFEYSILQIQKEFNLITEWNSLSLEEQGKLIAFFQLENMIKVIEAHEQVQKQEREKTNAKN